MREYVIIADVTCDLSESIREEFGISDYIRGHINFSDGRDFPTTLDWSHITREDFYKTLSNRKMEVTTAPASPEEYYNTFSKYAKAGIDVLSMSISSQISSTYQVTVQAANRVMQEYPDSKIYCLDSYKMSGAFGLLVMKAFSMKNEGCSMDQVAQWLEDNKHFVHQMGPIDDLIFVARRGRITMGKAIMGSFAGVKPMGDCTREGYVSVLTKAKGMNKALDLTVRYVDKAISEQGRKFVLICHSNRFEYAQKLKEMLHEKLHIEQVYVSDVFCACGPHIGPGMVAVYFFGDELSEGLVKEKELMNSLVNG